MHRSCPDGEATDAIRAVTHFIVGTEPCTGTLEFPSWRQLLSSSLTVPETSSLW